MITLTPKQTKKAIVTCLKAQLVPFIRSSPGYGKSSIVKEIAEEYGLKLIDLRLSSLEPTDIQGLPWIQNGKARFNPYEFFPLQNTPIPQGYNGWILFLDEMNSASRSVQAAAYRLVLDREVGMDKLHDNCVIIAAGNKESDKAIVNPLSTAMQSRVVHLNMDISFEDWRDGFAVPKGIDERIVAYLSMYPEKLSEFNPKSDKQTYPCPRTWHFASNLIKANNGDITSDLLPVLAGAISFEAASSFVQFAEVYKELVTIDKLKANPNIKCPTDLSLSWATIIHLGYKVDLDSFKYVKDFIEKFPATLQIVFFRTLTARDKSFLLNPEINFCFSKLGVSINE